METTINSNQIRTSVVNKSAASLKTSTFWDKAEFSRFGIISILVVVLGCIGGMAASFGAGDSIIKLAMIAFPTIITLALILAVAPMKIITYMSILALVLDVLVFVF
jgi:hypothetical protein